MRPGASYSNGSSSSPYDGATDSVVGGGNNLPFTDPSFDILDWHPAYQSCQRYFLDHAQHEPATQAVCALINIRLPFQRLHMPIASSREPMAPGSPAMTTGDGPSISGGNAGLASTLFANNPSRHPIYHASASNSNTPGNLPSPSRSRGNSQLGPPSFIPLIPYIRRLVVTSFDKPAILHGFFGDDYIKGVMPHVQCERRNYLFAAKGGGWRSCKRQYDVGSGDGGDESVPFMRPLDECKSEELRAAETAWSDWLAMEDWMVGPNAPAGQGDMDDEKRTGGSGRRVGAERIDGIENARDGFRDM